MIREKMPRLYLSEICVLVKFALPSGLNYFDALNCKDVTVRFNISEFVLACHRRQRSLTMVVPIVMVCGELIELGDEVLFSCFVDF